MGSSSRRNEFDRDDVVELAREMVRIETPNPPGEEKEGAEFIVEWFESHGFDTALVDEPWEDRPQVVASVGDGEPRIVFSGHIDEYPPGDLDRWDRDPHGASVEDGRLHGRGSVDMKTGIALGMLTMLALKEDIESGRLDGSIEFHAAVGNETGDGGQGRLLELGYGGDYAVVLEPTELRTVTVTKGVAWYEVDVYGEPAHSARPEQGVNAIEEACRLVELVGEYDDRVGQREHDLVGRAMANVTTFDAGTAGNMLPEDVTLTLERRFLPDESLESVDEEIRELLDRAAETDGIETSWQRVRHWRPAEEPADSELADAFRQRTADAADVPTDPHGMPWSCDFQFFGNEDGVSAITWGPGDSSTAGTYHEHIDVSEAETAGRVLLEVTRDLLSK